MWYALWHSFFSSQPSRVTTFWKFKCYFIQWIAPLLLKIHGPPLPQPVFPSALLCTITSVHLLFSWANLPPSFLDPSNQLKNAEECNCCSKPTLLAGQHPKLTFNFYPIPHEQSPHFPYVDFNFCCLFIPPYAKRQTTLPPPTKSMTHRKVLPVLNNPVFLSIYIFTFKTITYNQNTMVQVFTATVWFIVDTWGSIKLHMNKLIY